MVVMVPIISVNVFDNAPLYAWNAAEEVGLETAEVDAAFAAAAVVGSVSMAECR